MTHETSTQEPISRRRPWRTFSLRTMLILIAVAACGIWWFDRRFELPRRRIEFLQQRRGQVRYVEAKKPPGAVEAWLRKRLPQCYFDAVNFAELVDGGDADLVKLEDFPALDEISVMMSQVTDEGVARIATWKHIKFLDLSNTQITDQAVVILSDHPALEWLTLFRTPITDEAMIPLAKIRSLTFLELSHTQVTDRGLARLDGFKSLDRLILGDTSITGAGFESLQFPLMRSLEVRRSLVNDAGLVHIGKFKSLLSLDLEGTPVTDAGLEHLTGLTALRWLKLKSTKVTSDGVQRIQAALPGCRVSGP